ncbi:hypothetical protein NDU88_006025 [Pleurodeles waltl]|uniref:Uncharacterized protein n=1 Tax=Pleurodeles waltl TaxID=8319 RepID=A0AAV7L2L8_PLEWA|nr:hypothetical protein NDU88_006025 [Pleurodeles waltl]
MNRQVGDTLQQRDVPTPLQEQASERLRQRGTANDRTSRKRRAKDSPIQVGDQALIKNRRPVGKFRLPFEPMPFTVVRIRGTMVTAVKDQEQVTRNISFFKRYRSENCGAEGDTSTPLPGGKTAEAGDDYPDILELGVTTFRDDCPEDTVPHPRGMMEGQEGDSQSTPPRPNGNAGTLTNAPPHAGTERYHLRPKPIPSRKLKDFLVISDNTVLKDNGS